LTYESTKRRVMFSAAAILLIVALTIGMSSSTSIQAPVEGAKAPKKSKKPEPPHIDDYCSTNVDYAKTTLKPLIDAPVASLLVSKELKGQRKFETSDVILKDGYYYSVCDSSWAILKVKQNLPLLSYENSNLGSPLDASGSPESQFEAIFEDGLTGQMYVVREAIDVAGADPQPATTNYSAAISSSAEPPLSAPSTQGLRHRGLSSPLPTDHLADYRAVILEVDLSEDDDVVGYKIANQCASEISFPSDSKGFEGATSLRGADGVLYVLGLCEGNHCLDGEDGMDAGNGKIVVMAKAGGTDVVPGFDCYWKTVATLSIPSSALFVDYSAISLHQPSQTVAISSQENSQLWVGTLVGGRDGEFDPQTAHFLEREAAPAEDVAEKEKGKKKGKKGEKGDADISEGEAEEGAIKDPTFKLYDFPRTTIGCQVQYCNVEGLAWVQNDADAADDQTDDGAYKARAPQVLAAVSDQMKGHGKQPNACLVKDQSFHLFAIPP